MVDDTKVALSVLIPSYNYGEFIAQALDSAIDQRREGVEIIVVDDGSTDDTESVVRPYVAAETVRYFRQENQGVSAARNHAMEQARGRWLMFLDADDTLYPGCIEVTIDFLERHDKVGFFFTNYDLFEESGVVCESGVDIWRVFRSLPHREPAPREWIFTESLAPSIARHGSFMHTSGLTIRRDLAARVGRFRENFTYGEDDEFWVRAAYHTTAGYVDRVLSRKRNHQGSIIHDRSRKLRNALTLLELTEIQLRDFEDDPVMRSILERKRRDLVVDCCWSLIDQGNAAEAWPRLRAALKRNPLDGRLYKLVVKALLQR